MRLKAYIASRGVEFDAINVHENPAALAELGALGAKTVAVVVKNGRFAGGQDLEKVDELLGLKKAAIKLPPEELVDRTVRLIEAWMRFARQFPPAHYDDVTHGMEGIKHFTHPNGHIFRLSDGRPFAPHSTAYLLIGHVLKHARMVKLELEEPNSAVLTTQSLNSEYGESLPEVSLDELLADGKAIIDLIRCWWSETSGRDLEKVFDTFYGPQTLHQLLSREAYSLAQHTRQLMTWLIELGIEPDGPIGEAEYSGLNLPKAVWK
jgi:hypothetical protein